MKTLIKRFIIPLVCLFILLFVFCNANNWSNFLMKYTLNDPEVRVPTSNNYFKNYDFLFVQNVTNFMPFSMGDLKNIYFTIVNHGWNEFTFYCPSEYINCLDDVKTLSNDQDLLTHLNNYVHPYNSFSNVKTIISETGEINVEIEYFYDKETKETINKKVDEIYNSIITNDMDLYTKILTIHDYIINNTKYDVTRNNEGTSTYESYIAYGPLIEGYATCNGYADAMALFLEKLNVPNFKVAKTPDKTNDTEGHVWNAVYIENKWLHLDLTWDDPVSSDGTDYLQHKYFLISTDQLEEIDNSGEVKITEHDFLQSYYPELKKTEN